MNDRDCKNCIRRTIDGCTAWECEYINRTEAIEIYKAYKSGELMLKDEVASETH